MTTHPLLSVIVANFNNGRYLGECLDSILGQTFKNLEIVVCDDASTDGSAEVIRAYRERHSGTIKGLFNSENLGVASTRHRAVVEAGGEYLTTLDADDTYCNPRKLEAEIDLIRRCLREEGKEVIAFSNILLTGNGPTPRVWGTPDSIREGRIAHYILGRIGFIPRDFTMKREWYFDAGGYDDRFRIYEDWDLKIRLALKHEFRYTGELGTAYRRHSLGLSASPREEHVGCLRAIFDKNVSSVGFFRRGKIRKGFNRYLKALR